MPATIDVVTFSRRRDALRLLRRPRLAFGREPEFAKALLVAQNWRSSDLKTVAIIAGWEDDPGRLELGGAAVRESWRGVFDVQRGHGTVDGRDPLPAPSGETGTGPGVIWTCGNTRIRHLPAFLRQNARVVQELNRAPGLRRAFGVLGLWRHGPWMCTLSFWEDLDAGLAFAYRSSPKHHEAVKRMRSGGYGTRETYFARLGLVADSGAIGGRAPFAAVEAAAA